MKSDCQNCFYRENCEMSQDGEILKILFPKKGYPNDYCKNYIPSKAQVTERAQITEFLSKLLIRMRLTGMGKYYASEVTLDYGKGKGKQIRVDYMQFIPANQYSVAGIEKGKFICYEIKSCIEDVLSGHGLNAEGERNYIVTTMKTYKKIIELEQKGKEVIPHEFGVMVACHQNKLNEFDNPTPISYSDGWRLEVIKQASLKYRKRSMNELLFCMLRSGR